MRSYISDTRGSAGVLLCMMLLSFVLITGLLSGALCLRGAKASLVRASYLGGQSLLAEYDKYLLADYGIFAVRTDEETGAEKVKKYIEAAVVMKGEEDSLDIFGMRDVQVSLDLKSASLIGLEQFEKQIVSDMKYKVILDAIGLSSESQNLQKQITDSQEERSGGKSILLLAESEAQLPPEQQEGSEQQEAEEQSEERRQSARTVEQIKTAADGDVKRAVHTEGGTEERALRNKAVIATLPTRAGDRQAGWLSKLTAGADVLKDVFSGKNSDFYQFENLMGDLATGAYVNEYILKYCKNQQSGQQDKETFFQNEVEYVIYGKLKDGDNIKAFKEQFITLRTALNLLHIHGDAEKNQAVTSLAASAFPGPAAPAARLAIATAWAAAEAAEDLKVLEDGGKVPLLKTNQTWKLSWDNLVSGQRSDRSGRQEGETGLDYKGYLRLFLMGVSKESKLLRMMDIIQINMKGRYYKDFTIMSCYTGFQITAQAKTRAIGPVLKKGGTPWISVTSDHTY